jgi:very-short-patch-repair endonuclease
MRHLPTESEAALWRLIKGRQLGVSFKRQVPLLGYIVDFYASEAKLIVEVSTAATTTRGLHSMPGVRRGWSARGIGLCGCRPS